MTRSSISDEQGSTNGSQGITHPKKRAFLAAYKACGMVKAAAEAAEVDRSTHCRWRHNDPEYAAAFHRAQVDSSDVLEEEARMRALEGVNEPVYQGGKLVGHRKRYSDTLLIFLLKANNPRKFAEFVEHQHISADATANRRRVVIKHVDDWYGTQPGGDDPGEPSQDGEDEPGVATHFANTA